jgi:hypothetical protein
MKPAIIDIPGIGPATESTLAEHGFGTLKTLAGTSRETLANVPGFSMTRADAVISASRELLAGADLTGGESSATAGTEAGEDNPGKGGKHGKGKGKNKDKGKDKDGKKRGKGKNKDKGKDKDRKKRSKDKKHKGGKG